MTKAYKDAIANGRAKAKVWHNTFAEFDRKQGLVGLSCSCCGTPIAGVKEVGEQRVTRTGRQTIIQTRAAFIRFAAYREIAFKMSDGSKHVSNCCAGCVDELRASQNAREAFYAMDLSQWSSEGITLSDATCARKPVEVVAVAPEIGVI